MHYPHEKCDLEQEISPKIKNIIESINSGETPQHLKHLRSRSGGLFDSVISTNSV